MEEVKVVVVVSVEASFNLVLFRMGAQFNMEVLFKNKRVKIQLTAKG